VGLPLLRGNRRVPGLRRAEVAMLAGVSVDYYTRLERGNLSGASESVLDSLANAMQLDEAERGHLFDLARTANASAATRARPSARRIRPVVQQMLDAMTGAPAVVRNARLDYLAANRLGRALYADLFNSPAAPPNVAGCGRGSHDPRLQRRTRLPSADALNLLASWAATLDQALARDLVIEHHES
jgi:transcriptional regulator with XRE-family HTH domain